MYACVSQCSRNWLVQQHTSPPSHSLLLLSLHITSGPSVYNISGLVYLNLSFLGHFLLLSNVVSPTHPSASQVDPFHSRSPASPAVRIPPLAEPSHPPPPPLPPLNCNPRTSIADHPLPPLHPPNCNPRASIADRGKVLHHLDRGEIRCQQYPPPGTGMQWNRSRRGPHYRCTPEVAILGKEGRVERKMPAGRRRPGRGMRMCCSGQ